MVSWQGWPLERLVTLLSALAFLLLWMQLSLFHWRAHFRERAMWGPVVYTPLMIIIAAIFTVGRGASLELAYLVIFALGAVEGLIGCTLHLRGSLRLKGGLNLRNLSVGPPVLLTLLYALLAFQGFLIVVGLRL